MSKRILRKRELLDIIQGATFLGTGGGGSPKSGEVLVEGFLSGKEIDCICG